jgi:putative hydrolase of HD superfamily
LDEQTVSQLLGRINDLKQLPRTGWLFAGVSAPESVAEHAFATTWVALLLAETINADWVACGLHAPLKVDHAVRLALVHDLAEALLTDLAKRTTELLGRDIKYQAEERAMTMLFADFPNGASYVDLWAEYAAGETAEAQLVRDADKLEMVHQALRYTQRGQRNLQEFWQGHQWHYAVSATLFAHLLNTADVVAIDKTNPLKGHTTER